MSVGWSSRELLSQIITYLRTSLLVQGLTRTQPLYYVGYPRSDPVEFPIVAVTPTGGGRTHMSIGDTGNRWTLRFMVDFYTDTDAVSQFEGNVLVQNELVAYLYDMFNVAFRDFRCPFTSIYELIDVWITPLRILPYDEDQDLYRGICTLTIQLNDPKVV